MTLKGRCLSLRKDSEAFGPLDGGPRVQRIWTPIIGRNHIAGPTEFEMWKATPSSPIQTYTYHYQITFISLALVYCFLFIIFLP